MNRLPAVALAALLASCSLLPDSRPPAPAPDAARAQIAVTAHPLATRAALAMLDKGGSPIDAAIAAQMVLGLVEPQSSGLGGGTLVMNWDAPSRKLASFDGLAAAPARATASLRTDTDGKLLDSEPSQRGGRTVGVPGTLAVLALVHERHGKLAWRELFEPAIDAAERGFPMPRYLHGILSLPDAAKNHPDMRDLYFAADGTPHPVGSTIRNPAYAKTMRRIAIGGPSAFLGDGGAKAIVDAAQRGFRPTLMTEQDLRDYRAFEHNPVCAPFLALPGLHDGSAFLRRPHRAAGPADGGGASGRALRFRRPRLRPPLRGGGQARAGRSPAVRGRSGFRPGPRRALADPAYARSRARVASIPLARQRTSRPACRKRRSPPTLPTRATR